VTVAPALRRAGRVARTGLLALPVLAIAAYSARYVVDGRDAWTPALAPSFEARPTAIFLHALGGSVVLAAGLVQMNGALRRRLPRVHRGVGWAYAAAAALTGGAGVYLAAHSAGGPAARSGFGLLGLAVLAATARAVRLAVGGDLPGHRAWMVRSYALFLSAVTLRAELPLLGVAFGTVAGYQMVSWLCWVPNAVVAEWWLRRRRGGVSPVGGARRRGRSGSAGRSPRSAS
jgi:uncharacterized membrane protein